MCAPAGEPARTEHFVEEGRALVAANFLNLKLDLEQTLVQYVCARRRASRRARRILWRRAACSWRPTS